MTKYASVTERMGKREEGLKPKKTQKTQWVFQKPKKPKWFLTKPRKTQKNPIMIMIMTMIMI